MLSYISVGKILKTHGLKGALKIRPYNLSGRFFEYSTEIFLYQNNFYKKYEIEQIQHLNELLVIKFCDIDTIEEAQKLKDIEIFVLKDSIPVEDDEILYIDIIGFKASFNSKIFGEVVNIANYGAGEIYVVKKQSGTEVLLPDQSQFIDKIDYDNKIIYFKDIDLLIS